MNKPQHLVYVSGPYRCPNKTIAGVRRNIERARAVAEYLAIKGYGFICPHLNTAFMDGLCPDKFWLDMDLLILERCDRIVMVPGWKESQGSLMELEHARNRGLEYMGTCYVYGEKVAGFNIDSEAEIIDALKGKHQ